MTVSILETNKTMLEGLIRILENQITIKEHIGIIKSHDTWNDNEYYRDQLVLRDMENLLADYRSAESED